MTSRLLRIDARLDARLDAMLFRADSVRFEACPTFRAGAGPDAELCDCGWLEIDHHLAATGATPTRTRRFPRRRPARVAVPQAS